MPFIAICPHCHRGKFRVPTKKRGQPETCPKCQQHFLLLPEGAAATSADFYILPDPTHPDEDEAMASAARPEPTEAEATADASWAPTIREPVNIVPPAEPGIVPGGRPAADAGQSPSGGQAGAAPHGGVPAAGGDTGPQLVALVGGTLFGLGMVATLLPFGRLIGAGLLLLGLTLGGLALLGLESRRGLGWAALGGNALGLLVLTLLPSWVGVSEWLPPPAEHQPPPMVSAVSRDGRQTIVPAEWVDAAQAVWQHGDVRWQLVSAVVGPATAAPVNASAKVPPAATPMKATQRTREMDLRIQLILTNVGVARAVEFRGWASNPPGEMADRLPTLRTRDGQLVPLRAAESTGSGHIYPGKSGETTLVFAAPPPTDELRLELPAHAFGGDEPVRFRIPRSLLLTR